MQNQAVCGGHGVGERVPTARQSIDNKRSCQALYGEIIKKNPKTLCRLKQHGTASLEIEPRLVECLQAF